MRSVTSYFNAELFRGTLRRTWPLWAAYTLAWLLILPIMLFTRLNGLHSSYSHFEIAYDMLDGSLTSGMAMSAAFGIFFAAAMFAYLTNSRATGGLHAMPIRREGLFLTHYAAGLFCQVVTLLVSFALAALVTAGHGLFDAYAIGTGLLANVLMVLFFYSFAVLCMICTGQALAGAVFYGILNFLAVGMEALLTTFAGNFLYGYDNGYFIFSAAPLSPIVQIARHLDVLRLRANQSDSFASSVSEVIVIRVNGLGMLAVYAAVGLVLAVLALLLYRTRRSEMTGNTVAITWLRPVFKYGVALCSAFSLGQLLSYFVFQLTESTYTAGALVGTILCMIFAGLLGYYAAEMLLKKSFHVFKASWKGALATVIVLILVGISFPLDLTGYQSYVPGQDEIVSATVDLHGGNVHGSFNLHEQESLTLLRDTHQAVITDKARQTEYNRNYVPYDGDCCMFRILYNLADGSMVSRSYDLSLDSALLSDPSSPESALTRLAACGEVTRERVLGGHVPDDLDALRITGGWVNCDYYSGGKYDRSDDAELDAIQANNIFIALMQDCVEDNIETADLFSRAYDESGFHLELDLWYYDSSTEPHAAAIDSTVPVYSDSSNGSFYLQVVPQMTATMRALRALNLIEIPD